MRRADTSDDTPSTTCRASPCHARRMKKIYLGGPVNKSAERALYLRGATRRMVSFAYKGKVKNFIEQKDYDKALHAAALRAERLKELKRPRTAEEIAAEDNYTVVRVQF